METNPIKVPASALETGWRGSRDLWLRAAYGALVEKGVEAVKIQPLAEKLILSRTSFYWFFKDRAALLSALAELWAEATTAPLLRATKTYAATQTEAMLSVIGCFISGEFDARFEQAVRAWAQQDPQIRAQIQAADRARLDALREMLAGWGHDPASADVRARTIYLVQIGYISMQTQEDMATRLARAAKYVEIYTGFAPLPEEIQRFEARALAEHRR